MENEDNSAPSTYRDLSHARIQAVISKEAQYESVADLLADVLHFCDKEGVEFQSVLEQAAGYVRTEEEVSAFLNV